MIAQVDYQRVPRVAGAGDPQGARREDEGAEGRSDDRDPGADHDQHRGIDVGAKSEIYSLMHKLAEKGVAIIMVSSDMEEVLGVSDRIAVMHNGEISGMLQKEEFTEENVMQLAVGNTKK